METQDYINSGILELYVYGLLSESENLEVAKMAKAHTEVDAEILSIEKSILNLSTSFSPFLSADNFAKIKAKLELKHSKVVDIQPKSSIFTYIGWAAAVVLLIGFGYQYNKTNQTSEQVVVIENEKTKLQEALVTSEINNKQTQDVLSVVRDAQNTLVNLGGQTAAPQAFAKIYYNKQTAAVYVDAAGLPEPPEGKVYQVWALKLDPLTPTSIGLLENFKSDPHRIFSVDKAAGAEGFGITLEPAGGSVTPTMAQLYTLGKV